MQPAMAANKADTLDARLLAPYTLWQVTASTVFAYMLLYLILMLIL